MKTYKPKNCVDCEKEFEPLSSNHRRCDDCKPEHRKIRSAANTKTWATNNPEKRKELNRKRNLLDYGLTPEQYSKILEDQKGVCAICKNLCRSGKRLAVDHDHKCCPGRRGCCGECIRGLLCRECNTGIGLLEGNIFRAIWYIIKSRVPWL